MFHASARDAKFLGRDSVTIKDIGPQPQSFDLEQATLDNENYRGWHG